VFTWTTTEEGWLILGWPSYPGWHAELDGRRVTVETVDGALPAIWSPRGTHRLEWVYDPTSVRLGAALSIIGLVLVLCWTAAILWPFKRVRRQMHPSPTRRLADNRVGE